MRSFFVLMALAIPFSLEVLAVALLLLVYGGYGHFVSFIWKRRILTVIFGF